MLRKHRSFAKCGDRRASVGLLKGPILPPVESCMDLPTSESQVSHGTCFDQFRAGQKRPCGLLKLSFGTCGACILWGLEGFSQESIHHVVPRPSQVEPSEGAPANSPAPAPTRGHKPSRRTFHPSPATSRSYEMGGGGCFKLPHF